MAGQATFESSNFSSDTFTTTPPPPFVNRLNWMFSENVPYFGDADGGGGYIHRMAADIGMDMQNPYNGGTTENIAGWDSFLWNNQ